MLYIKIYLKKLVCGFNPEQKKTNTVYLVRFLNEVLIKQSIHFYTRTIKLVLEKYFLKRENNFLSVVSNCVIFSYFGR